MEDKYYPINMRQSDAIEGGAKFIEVEFDPEFEEGKRIVLRQPPFHGGSFEVEITSIARLGAAEGKCILGIKGV